MSNNYTQILTRGLQSSLNNTNIEDGKIRVSTDTRRLFIDINDNERIEISDIIIDYTEEEIKSLLAPLPKLYLSSDTHKLFIFDDNGECVEISSSRGGTEYTHPEYTSHESGFYKIEVDSTGHVSNVATVTKEDIIGIANPVHKGDSAPDNINMLWIDTANDGVMKYYDEGSLTWKAIVTVAVWG